MYAGLNHYDIVLRGITLSECLRSIKRFLDILVKAMIDRALQIKSIIGLRHVIYLANAYHIDSMVSGRQKR